jgi:predicted DNA-binding transcriptional regulator AlpA
VSTPDRHMQNATLLTARQVADLLGVHVRSVWRLAQTGAIPAPIRLSERVVRWRLIDLKLHLEQLAAKESRLSQSRIGGAQ